MTHAFLMTCETQDLEQLSCKDSEISNPYKEHKNMERACECIVFRPDWLIMVSNYLPKTINFLTSP